MVPPVLPPQLGAGPWPLLLLVLPAVAPLSPAAWQAVFAPGLVVVMRKPDRIGNSKFVLCPRAPVGLKGRSDSAAIYLPRPAKERISAEAPPAGRESHPNAAVAYVGGARKAVKPALSSLWSNAPSV